MHSVHRDDLLTQLLEKLSPLRYSAKICELLPRGGREGARIVYEFHYRRFATRVDSSVDLEPCGRL
jgi:hypothetical protein